MKNNEHLTQAEIIAYARDLLPHHELYQIGRHLFDCPDCRRRVPSPTVEQIHSALMTDWEVDENPQLSKNRISISSVVGSIWSLHSNWVFGTVSLIILLIFSFLIWQKSEKWPNEIARNFEDRTVADLTDPPPGQTPNTGNGLTAGNSNRSVIAPILPKPAPAVSKPKQTPDNIRHGSERTNFNPNRESISETRGKQAKSNEQQSMEMQFSPEKENYVFKWRKLPNAAKYHIYISDDDEKLVDEFETTSETIFVLKKPLEPMKTYKWKIIVTLENGQTIVGDSQKFNINKFQNNLKKFNRKENLGVRCLANK